MNYEHFFKNPIILEDEWARLEPLEEKHFELLLPTAMQTSIWEFTMAKIYSAEDFRKYFDTALEEKKQHRSYPFAIFDKKQQEYLGCTRFGNIDLKNKKVEIGWTWLHPKLHATGFNKHCKFLLLSFCFEKLQLIRVELKTSSLNLRSQKAMLKIGAVKEGTLRRNFINDDGTIRDSVYFSFINEEWPGVKQNIFKEFC
ncbi:MAG: GNAT family N-acetyltransferase [Chitinophagaceae bacterium]|nr:GNAT family N-acetyltransferase [Chitinophagaceae bacterium]